MIPFAYAVLFLWIVAGPMLFASLPNKRTAVLTIFVAGFLFLPEIVENPSNPDTPPALGVRALAFYLTKANAMSYGFLLGAFLFDRARLLAFRPRWFDVPMIVWCSCPFLSALTNGDPTGHLPALRPIPGVIMSIQQTMMWGVPYLAGRVYITDLGGIHELAQALLLGGLAYVPLIGIEKVLSPQLHRWIYGFHAHDFNQAVRSGYRPTVFLEHGLMTALWMVAATLLSFWVWWTHALERLTLPAGLPALPMGLVAALILGATLCMNSAGALGLCLLGGTFLVLARVLPMRLALVGLMMIPLLYMAGRSWVGREPTGWLNSTLDSDEVERLERQAMRKPMFGGFPFTMNDANKTLTEMYNKDRAESMLYRFKQEDRLMEKAMRRPILGWGGEGRARLYDPRTREAVSVADGMWIQVLGDRGFLGLTALCLVVLLPTARFVWVYPSRLWGHPALAPAAVMVLVLVLWMIDNISNAMFDPLFILSAGALGSVTGLPVTDRREKPPKVREGVPEASRPVTPPPLRPEPGAGEVQRPGVLQRRIPSKGRSEPER